MMSSIEEYILNIPKFAGKTSLDNTKYLLNKLDISEEELKIIHVAGTNGKGSVCSYISNVLVKAGKKTGLFVSPHLVKMNERIRINNEPVSDELFNEAFYKVKDISVNMEKEGYKHASFFEFLFGMAMLIFKEQKVDYIVLETGLGGRLDSTNIFEKPVMTVITSVSMDHMDILGDRIEMIASEKAGIIKKKVPIVFYGENEAVKKVIIKKAEEMQADYICVDKASLSNVKKNNKFIDFSLNNRYYCEEHFAVNSQAYYQAENAAIAATALAGLNDKDLSVDIIKDGIRTSRWEGRMEEILPEVFIDGAHNEDGVRAFLETAGLMKDGSQILMFSAVADKAYEKMIQEICSSEVFDMYVVCAVNYEKRAMQASALESIFKKYTDKPVYAMESAREAFEKSLALKAADNKLFIAGSLYLVGEIKEIVNNR